MRILISYIHVILTVFDFWKIIKLSSFGRIFSSRYKMNWISKIFLCRLLFFFTYFNLNAFNLFYWHSFFIFLLFVIFKLFYFIFIEHFLPVHAIFESQFFLFQLILSFLLLLTSYFGDSIQKLIILWISISHNSL